MFRLIFPRWDVITIILSVFLMTYTYIEAKSNYHRGSILILRFAIFLLTPFFAFLTAHIVQLPRSHLWFLLRPPKTRRRHVRGQPDQPSARTVSTSLLHPTVDNHSRFRFDSHSYRLRSFLAHSYA